MKADIIQLPIKNHVHPIDFAVQQRDGTFKMMTECLSKFIFPIKHNNLILKQRAYNNQNNVEFFSFEIKDLLLFTDKKNGEKLRELINLIKG